jgi:Rrf2 family iron-sulfur cluster assembly transcriptional regulator
MILGTKARYAVMAMVELAGHDVCQEITIPYLEQIFSKLRKSGLVKSVRGPGGGYVLARPADSIFISEIIMAMDESLKMTRCAPIPAGEKGCMASKSRCLTHDLWEGLGRQIYSYLSSISLDDIRAGRVEKGAGPSGICASAFEFPAGA